MTGPLNRERSAQQPPRRQFTFNPDSRNELDRELEKLTRVIEAGDPSAIKSYIEDGQSLDSLASNIVPVNFTGASRFIDINSLPQNKRKIS